MAPPTRALLQLLRASRAQGLLLHRRETPQLARALCADASAGAEDVQQQQPSCGSFGALASAATTAATVRRGSSLLGSTSLPLALRHSLPQQQARTYASLPAPAAKEADEAAADAADSPAPRPRSKAASTRTTPGKKAADEEQPTDESAAALEPDAFRRTHNMRVEGADPLPDPIQSYSQALSTRALPPPLVAAFKKAGFSAPTYIQAQAWPIAATGRDLVAIAATGSGKTLGFLAPAFAAAQKAAAEAAGGSAGADAHYRAARAVHLRAQQRLQPQQHHLHRHPSALVLAPTRELAQQTHAEAQRFGKELGLRSACLFGGASRGEQARALRARPAIIVATPGRLLDFVRSGDVDLSRVRCLVLDEADRMLDMGFEPQIRELAEELPSSGGGGRDAAAGGDGDGNDGDGSVRRQTLFFSATWPREVQGIARTLCRNAPVRVLVGEVAARPVANRAVDQKAVVVPRRRDALAALTDYVRSMPEEGRAIVFCNTKFECERVAERLADDVPELVERSRRAARGGGRGRDRDGRDGGRYGYSGGRSSSRVADGAAAVHGDKSQQARDAALSAFREGRLPVLVATDVAARGLDIQGVTHVINLSFPRESESYVHRIGRTGRAGATGEALTVIALDDPDAAASAAQLARVMAEAGKPVPEDVADLAARAPRRGGGGGRGGRGFGSRGGRFGGSYGGGGGGRRFGGGGRRFDDDGGFGGRGDGEGDDGGGDDFDRPSRRRSFGSGGRGDRFGGGDRGGRWSDRRPSSSFGRRPPRRAAADGDGDDDDAF
jgi:ATP-dependent RNA helicase DDX5/DBP2